MPRPAGRAVKGSHLVPDTFMTTRSSSCGRGPAPAWAAHCELAPRPDPPVGVLRRVAPEPWPDPQTPHLWLFREPPSGYCVYTARGHLESVLSPASPREASAGPQALASASPGLLWPGSVHPAGLVPFAGRMALGWGAQREGPSRTLGETRAQLQGAAPQPELPQKHAGCCRTGGSHGARLDGALTWPPGRLLPEAGRSGVAGGASGPPDADLPSSQWWWVGGPRMLTLPLRPVVLCPQFPERRHGHPGVPRPQRYHQPGDPVSGRPTTPWTLRSPRLGPRGLAVCSSLATGAHTSHWEQGSSFGEGATPILGFSQSLTHRGSAEDPRGVEGCDAASLAPLAPN